MTGELDTLAKKCKVLALEVQYMPCLADKARSLHSRVVVLAELSEKKTSKVRTKLGTVEMKVVMNRHVRGLQSLRLELCSPKVISINSSASWNF